MQHWLDKLKVLAAIHGDVSTIKYSHATFVLKIYFDCFHNSRANLNHAFGTHDISSAIALQTA
jgi:hypothetical protein